MSPVRQVLRRLSAGARKRNHHAASILELPNAKRGRVELEGPASLPMGNELSNVGLFGDPQQYDPEGLLAEMDSTGERFEAMAADYDRLFPNNHELEVTRRPLQQSWRNQPPAELAAASAPPRRAATAEQYGTAEYSPENLISSAPSLRISTRHPPAYPWSPDDVTGYGISPTETQLQMQTRANLMHSGTSTRYTQQFQDPDFGLDPTLKHVSGYSLAPSLNGQDSFQAESGMGEPWLTGPDYSQYGQTNLAGQIENTGAAVQPTGYMTGASAARLSVVTQPTPAHQHAYGQHNGAWTPTNRQLATPVSTISAPSATSTNSSIWDLHSSISSASTGRTSTNTTSPTKSSTNISSEASGKPRRIFTFPGWPAKPSLVSPGAQATVASMENSISPGTESVGQCEICPVCGHKPGGKDKKNLNAHMERHLKTHQPGIPCEFPGCEQIIAGGRTDNMRQHMIKAHNQLEKSRGRGRKLSVPSMTPTGTPQSASLGYEDVLRGSWSAQYEVNGRGSHRGSTVLSLTGLVSGNETQFDSQQTPGGLDTVEEDKHDLDTGSDAGVRPSDIGPTAWNGPPSWI